VTGLHTIQGSDKMEMHHNVLRDKGTEIANRHQGATAVTKAVKMHHNLITRARQRGLTPVNDSEVYHNEIYIDSWATNSFAITGYSTRNAKVYGNRLFGAGYMAIGIGTVSSNVANIDAHDNFVLMQATKPLKRWDEYGAQSGVHGMRITWGGENLHYHDNVFVTRAREGGKIRGMWVCPDANITGVLFENNIVKAVCEDAASDGNAAISICGDGKTDHAPMVFRNNRIMSNFLNVRTGESYGVGNNTRFYGNTLERIGPARDDYRTIQVGFWNKPSAGHEFYDTRFAGGAGFDSFKFDGNGEPRNFAVGYTLTLATVADAEVRVTDTTGAEVFSGKADEKGKLAIPLLHYRQWPDKKVVLTPHTVVVSAGDKTASGKVTIDQALDLTLKP
jgi:hypothetical protein